MDDLCDHRNKDEKTENGNANFSTFLNFFMSGKEKNKGAKRMKNIHDFFDNIFFFLKYLGYFSYIHKTLISKLLNILKAYIISMKKKRAWDTHVTLFLEKDGKEGKKKRKGYYKLHKKFDALFIKFFFMCLVNGDEKDNSITKDLWNVLRLLPASRRYKLYSKFFKKLEMYKKSIISLKQIKENIYNTSTTTNTTAATTINNNNNKNDMKKESRQEGRTKLMATNAQFINKMKSLDSLKRRIKATRQIIPIKCSDLRSRSLNLLSIINFEVVKHKLRTIIKRITADILKDRYNEKVQTMLKQLTKIVNINPFICADIILQQCELFDNNMIVTLAESVKGISHFSSDIFLYKIVERQQLLKVANYKLYKLKSADSMDSVDDFVYKPKRLINLSLMSAKFLAKHPSVDFFPLVISTIKRIFSEFHNSDRIVLQSTKRRRILYEQTKTNVDTVDTSVAKNMLQERTRDNRMSIQKSILKAANKKYPDEMIGYLFDLDYIQKLLEIYSETVVSVNVQELTDDQLNAQCGYKTLKKEIMILKEISNQDISVNANMNNADFDKWEKMQSEDEQLKNMCIRNAKKTFLNPNVIYLIFFMLSKMKYEFVFDSNTTNIKNIASLFDRIHSFLLHFIDFLQMNAEVDVYLSIIPNAKVLFHFFENAQAFHILRFAFPFFTEQHSAYTSKIQTKQTRRDSKESTEQTELEKNLPNYNREHERKWKEIVTPVLEKCCRMEQLKGINSLFCVTFWRLDISDIYVPHKQYLKVIAKYDKSISSLDKMYEENKRNEKYSWAHKQIKKLRLKKMNINNEYDRHVYHTNKIKKYLSHIVEQWVDPEEIEKQTFVLFTKYLIAPRILYSERDALFCSKFLLLLLEFETPLFNFCVFTYICTKMLIPLINTCTEREALNLGIFFNDFYSYIYLLCNDANYFHKNTFKNPCFAYNLNFQSRDTITHSYILEKVLKWEKMIVTLLFKKKNYEKSWISSKALVIFLFRFFKSFPNSKSIKATMKIYLTFLKDFAQGKGWRDIVISVNSLITDIERQKRLVENEKKEKSLNKQMEQKNILRKPKTHMFMKDVENITMNPFGSSNNTPMRTNPYYMPLIKNIYNPNLFPMVPTAASGIINNAFLKEGIYGNKGGIPMEPSNPIHMIRRNVNFTSNVGYLREGGGGEDGINNMLHHNTSNIGNKRRAETFNTVRNTINPYGMHSHNSSVLPATTKNVFATHPHDNLGNKKMRIENRNVIHDSRHFPMNPNYMNAPPPYIPPPEDDNKSRSGMLSHIQNYLKNNRNTNGYYRK